LVFSVMLLLSGARHARASARALPRSGIRPLYDHLSPLAGLRDKLPPLLLSLPVIAARAAARRPAFRHAVSTRSPRMARRIWRRKQYASVARRRRTVLSEAAGCHPGGRRRHIPVR